MSPARWRDRVITVNPAFSPPMTELQTRVAPINPEYQTLVNQAFSKNVSAASLTSRVPFQIGSPMGLALLSIAFFLFGLVWIGLIQRFDAWARATPRPTWLGGLVYLACLWASHRVHHVQYEGLENVPKGNPAGPFIVVANHTAGIDPILIQCGCEPEIRWMMLRDMDAGFVRFFTWFARLILVDRNGRDLASTREALRHLKNGGVLGIFAEASIENPPRLIRPFMPGVGFLVARSGVPVLPVWVSGTPFAEDAMRALLHWSQARVVFGEMMKFDHRRIRDAEAITAAIRDRIIEMSGW